MSFRIRENLQKIFVLGISYRKSALDIREKFSIQSEQQNELLKEAKELGVEGMMVLSTCNRTEVYAFAQDVDQVVHLFLKYCQGNLEDFNGFGYLYKGHECLQHIYKVASGMDSQIIGDFQIVGQVKDAYRMADGEHMINPFMNRLFSFVFKASKKIKNETELSKGAASVAHAAVQYIKDKVEDLDACRFLLLGTGEIGKVTCENLLKHMNNRSLTLINRTREKAENLAAKFQIQYCGMEQLKDEVRKSDVIVVATGARTPVLCVEHFQNCEGEKLVLDLSVPRNVETAVDKLDGVSITTVDELSRHIAAAMEHRLDCIPMAQKIIEASIGEFYGWLEVNYLSPVIVALKENLHRIQEKELDYHRSKIDEAEMKRVEHITSNIVNKIARACINHLKDHHKKQSSPMETLEMLFKESDH
ncbi:MAG: glutamyl-tRNA reductase [Marinifilaceae bacterium]|jgi:glutamyl-tRNA reductase